MHYLHLIKTFMQASFQEEAAYRSNFWLSLFYSFLNLGTGILAVIVLFNQVESVNGWNLTSTMALLGVYLLVSALRGLFIGPGLESLSGMDGEIWSGKFDFTVLRPVNIQFMVSLRKWRWFALFDIALAVGVLVTALLRMGSALGIMQWIGFLLALFAGILILYAILLTFAALVFWSPEVLFTWVFDGLFQLARYPVGMYPGWIRLVLTWIIPVGIITTVPAQALTQNLSVGTLITSLGVALLITLAASLLFKTGVNRYASASS
jgi:ABC-2 type transport system permease protein